ncbi:hypothetical protein [Chryseobacterium sp. MP_3.2]|uniref:hypothetical protein n=1 Tax=Chryseobacterium sp. MP_3.2 TaxID=3071712 RepID=UPI002E0761DF|nr:hypothetical protein [Chryseobacterium sp. MP_3.2]
MNFDEIELDDLLEFLETGSPKNVPPKLAEYMLMLEKIWGMYRRGFEFPNKEAIVKHLVIVHNLHRFQAVKLINDTFNYFKIENNLPKDTWRFLIADMMRKNYMLALRLAKTTKDARDANSIVRELGDVIGLDKDDILEMEEDLMKQIQVLTTDIKMFGEEPEDRRAIAQFIDDLPDVPEKIKEAAKAEVDGLPFRFLNFEENPRK